MQNVFEFIGLPEDHRKVDKVVQFVKHYDEVPESKKTWPMLGQVKKDGVYALIVVRIDKKVGIFSRTGKRYTNVYYIEDKIYCSNLRAGIYIAELCNSECSLEELSGIVNPNRKKALTEKQNKLLMTMSLYFHDLISLESFISGCSPCSYKDRYAHLMCSLPNTVYNIIPCDVVQDEEHFLLLTQESIAKGEEGFVLKQPDEDWIAGHKGYRVMKKVRGVSYDLLCIRAEEGKGKYKGKIANLFFRWKDGKTIKAMLGKGWTHLDAEEMLTYKVLCPVGQIFEVYALQESSKGKLRLPKVGELRHDKTEPDIK